MLNEPYNKLPHPEQKYTHFNNQIIFWHNRNMFKTPVPYESRYTTYILHPNFHFAKDIIHSTPHIFPRP